MTSAGHPPPLIVAPDGETWFLEGDGGLPLGVTTEVSYTEAHGAARSGDDRRPVHRRARRAAGPSIDEGLTRLAEAASAAPREPDAFVDAVIAELLGGEALQDDVALLAVVLDPALLAPLELTFPADPTRCRSSGASWRGGSSGRRAGGRRT